MSDFLDRIKDLSPKRLALLAMELREELDAEQRRGREPIAVVGMACRLPGAQNPDGYWALLREGREAIREVPADRWDIDAWYDPDPDVAAHMACRAGGFLDRVDGFDAAFFGISPREALTMDPQQRLLLEVSWEALEHAGISPALLAGSASGVFIGVCNSDHYLRVIERGAAAIDAYLASGNAPSVVAGRVAYVLGLHGPALAIDTACSSSLIAIHAACQSLRSGQTRLALAGGVNIMCSPQTTIALSRAHMLAPDGRCKTFDAAADGFARGEGCGVLVLKRLADAEADGDRILAIVRGIASNQDGRSGGLTVPNGPAQEAVIRAALADAELGASDIDYVEAHGTGTTLGDPIEVRALAGALGAGRGPDNPLLIGSVKTNLGHLESAAGVAGIMKVILALQHEEIPPHLHFRTPSPHIAWPEYAVRVTDRAVAWPRGPRPRRAGVSSFGFSGTNAHVILEEAPVPTVPVNPVDRPLHCLPLSARTDASLREVAASYARALADESNGALPLPDVAHTLGVGRAHLAERVAVVAGSNAEAAQLLQAAADGMVHPAVFRGTARADRRPEVVFLYTGQGAQYPGMSRALYQSAPAFREVIDRCDLILGEREGRTLRGVLFDPPGDAPAIHETIWTQPALFAVEYALTQLWRSWGIEPAGVIGHSVGEYVAACVAGVFDLEEGLTLIAERGRLMQGLPAGGAMAAIFASAEEVAAAVAPRADRIAVAAFNAPDNTVIAGDSAAVDQLLAELALRNIQGQRLFVSLAAHSPLTDPILDGMERCAARVEMKAPRIPMVWNLTGQSLPARVAPDAGYWRRHLREPVRFADGMQALHQQGFRAFLEVGPHPTLMALAQRSLPGEDILWLSSLRRGKEDWPEMLASLAALYVHGANVDWVGVDRPYARRRATLPTYPFERKRYWIEPTAPGTVREGPRRTGTHPLLGQRLATADPTFELRVEERSPSYLEQHRIHGQVVVPGPVLLELAQASARDAFGSVGWAVEEFSVHAPLVPGASGRMVQVRLAEGDEHVALRIHSRAPAGGDAWQLHATALLAALEGTTPTADSGNGLSRHSMTAGLRDEYYARLAGLGVGFGPAFQTIRQAWAGPGQACALIELGEEEAGDPVVWAHPALVDGALQAIGLAIPVSGEAEAALLTGIERVELSTPLPTRVICTVRLRSPLMPPPPEWEADVELWSEEGRRLGVLSGVRLRRAGSAALRRALRMPEAEGLFHQVEWQPAPGAAQPALQLTPVAEVAAPVEQAFSALAREHDLSLYDRMLPELDGLSASYVHRAFVDLGFDTTAGRRFTSQSEAGRLGVTARQARLFGRLLQMLVEDGVLARNGPDEFTVAGALRVVDVAPHLDSLLTQFQANDGELSMLRRAGPALARVLRGEQDPLHLLFPGGSFAEARRLYVESAVARTYNGTLVELLRRSLAQLPAGRVLRVLEIGAGTGGTTEYVLPSLAGTRVEYTFTDLSPLFLERATERFGSSPYFRTAILDIERDPGVQGFDARAYDVIIAANVLHATADLERTLSHARGLLAPGGQLCLLEGVAPERWVDLTFGLTEGWWRFSDRTLRPDYPLVDRAAWLGLLDRLNFRDVRAFPDVPTARAARQQVLLVARAPVESRKQWTLLADASGVAEALARLLTARGDVVTVHPADSDEASSGEVVYLGALDLGGVPASPAEAADCERLSCALPLRLLRGVVRQGGAARAWLVTSSAQGVTVPTETTNASQAPLWGLGRVWALEHPECWGGLIDLPSGSPVELADVLLQALDSADQEDQVAWRDGVRYVPRLVRVQPPAVPAPELRGDGAYLVTGGFGGLGLVTARWLAERGAGTIVLLGRRAPEEADGIRDIERAGARVRTVATDVADENAMALLSRRFGTEWPPLRGIVHTAADFSSAPMLDLTDEQVTRMLRAKVAGTVLLSRLAASQPLDFLVLYSSSTAVLGASGFAHYAAANQFLDAFAEAEDRPGRRVLSVNWGTWEVMRGASDAAQQDYRRSGLEPMRTVEALDALGRMLGSDAPRKLVARIDWTRLKPLLESRRARPMLEALDRAAERPAASGPVVAPARGRATLEQLLARRPAAQRHDVLVDFVSREVAEVLGRGTNDPVPPEAGLFELGMDSLMSVELKRRLDAGTGRTLPSTLTFNYPTVSALAGFIELELGPRATAPVAAPPVLPAADTDESSDEELEARLLAKLEELR